MITVQNKNPVDEFADCNKPMLAKCFISVTLAVLLVDLFGPYEWHIYNFSALIYLFICFAAFFLSLKCGELRIRTNRASLRAFHLTGLQKAFLVALSVFSIVCFFVEVIQFLRFYGSSYTFLGGAYYDYAEEGRGIIDQLMLAGMQLGTVSYLMMSADDGFWNRSHKYVITFSLFTYGAYSLLQGSRFASAVTFIIYFIVQTNTYSSRISDQVRKLSGKRLIQLVFLITGGVILLIMFLTLMDTRLIYSTVETKYFIFPGDQVLRDTYKSLNDAANGGFHSIYNLLSYIGEAPFVFSGYWNYYIPDQLHIGSYSLRPLAKLLNGIGLTIIADPVSIMQSAGGGGGHYATFVWPLIQEFGIYLTPLVAFAAGLLFAKIENLRVHSFICRTLYPCCVAICIFAPIYFFNVGRMDYVFFEALLVQLVLSILNRGSGVPFSVTSNSEK